MGILSLFRRRTGSPENRRDRVEVAVPKHEVPPAGGSSVVQEAAPAVLTSPAPTLVAPVITEKATVRQAEGWYTFRVLERSSKPEIKRTVERQFGVHVERVRVLNVHGKVRRRGRIVGHVPGYRKAFVQLQTGEKIQPEQLSK